MSRAITRLLLGCPPARMMGLLAEEMMTRHPHAILSLALRGVRPAFVPVAAAVLIALPVTASGQPPAMSGLVRHRLDGKPIECLHVALADSLDRTVAHTVTDSAGMFVLVAPDIGSFRVEFDMPGLEPLTGPLVRLAAGEMNEQEYPISFDRRIPGELELIGRSTKTRDGVDLGDWHPVDFSRGGRTVSEIQLVGATNEALDVKRIVAQFIVDSTGRPRANSWRTIANSDAAILTSVRSQYLARHYAPARIGEQRVCQLVMTQWKFFRTHRG